MLANVRVFWREFRDQYHTTGAVLPSGPALARSLARYLTPQGPPRRVLEVGPGTGAVTASIVRRIRPGDSLDLVELNERFVSHLQARLASDPAFVRVAGQTRLWHRSVQDVAGEAEYDVIVSGLPLNNFAVDDVEQILGVFRRLGRPGGTLSFFEYIAVRQAKAILSGRAGRARLRGISRALKSLLAPHEVRRDWVWLNVPPAWVHHVRWP